MTQRPTTTSSPDERRRFERCPVCEADTGNRVVKRYAQRLQLPAPYQIVKCLHCHTSRLEPQPIEKRSGSHYDESTYYAVGAYEARAENKTPHFKERLRQITALLGNRPGKTLLDFGCAGGHFLELAKSDGWIPYGVEVSTQLAASATEKIGNPVFHEIEDAAESLPESLDAVHSNHSLEHVRDAAATIRNMHLLLRTGGILAIEVPHQFGSWLDLVKLGLIRLLGQKMAFRFFKPPVDALHHMFFFTPASLSRLLERYGFRVERLSTVNRSYQLPPQGRGLPNRLRVALESAFAMFQKGSIIEIYARKKP